MEKKSYNAKSSKKTQTRKSSKPAGSKKTITEEKTDVEQIREESDLELHEAAKSSSTTSSSEGLSGDNQKSHSDQKAYSPSKGSDVDSKRITIVIPYKESAAKGNELLYALRAWDKFFPDADIVIIGDKPEFVNDQIKHIKFPDSLNGETLAGSPNPQIDVAQKLLLACESELVSDYFIISNDDIYPVCPVTLTYIDLPTTMGRLKQRGAPGGMYRENAERTLQALKKAGVKAPWDYATHTPMGVWKKELKEVIEKYNATKKGFLVGTLYMNLSYPSLRPIVIDNGVKSDHPGTQSYVGSAFKKVQSAAMAEAFKTRVFINNDDRGYDSVLPFLKKLFPEKSRFEI